MSSKDITPETHFGMKIASWAVVIIFISTTFIGVGTILQEQAHASTRIAKVEDQIEKLVERTADKVELIQKDVAEIKGMLKERK